MARATRLASRKRLISIPDLHAVQLPGAPALSPDGRLCALVVQRTDVEKNTYYSDLHLVDLESGECRPLTEGPYSDSAPTWSPDGRSLAFISTRSEKPQIHVMPMRGGDSRQVTRFDHGSVGSLAWSPDGDVIWFLRSEAPPEDRPDAVEARTKRSESPPARVIEGVFWRLDGAGYLGTQRDQVWRVDLASGEAKQVTNEPEGVGCFSLSPDGSALVVTVTPDILRAWDTRLLLIPTGKGRRRRIAAPDGPKYALTWAPDGTAVAWLGAESSEDPWTPSLDHVWVAPADGSSPAIDLTPGEDRNFSPSTLGDCVGAGGGALEFSEDGTALDVFVAERGAQGVLRIPRDATPARTLVSGHVHAYAKSAERGGKLIVAMQSPVQPGEAYVVGCDAAGEPACVTSFNAKLVAELHLTAPVEREVPCEETGTTIHGWVLSPPKPTGGRRPLLLEIHGGPHMQYGAGFMHEFHWLAAQGWTIAFTNPVGSQGYGLERLLGLRHHWGEADFPELMAFVDDVVRTEPIDPARTGVTGGSYGGFMTNWVVAHTDRFRVAATQRCVSNLVSMAGTSDGPLWPDGYFAGNAWSRPEELWRLSPIRLVENIHTPLLVLHSEGDLRCNIEQAEQIYSALKVLGRRTRFVRFPREASHGLSRGGPPDLRRRRLEELTAWLAAELGGPESEAGGGADGK